VWICRPNLTVRALRKGESSISTSLLYHALGLDGYAYQRTTIAPDGIEVFVKADRPFACAVCASPRVVCRGVVERKFKAPPFGKLRVFIVLPVQRLQCRACGAVRQAHVSFADRRRSYTHGFERYALEISLLTTIQAAAAHLGVSWDVIKEIQKSYYKKKFGRPDLTGLRRIAIDEVCIGSGYRYLTVVMNLESGAVVFCAPGRSADTLLPFWSKVQAAAANIEAVAIDMGPAYIAAVQEHLPNAVIVFDHFHVIKLFNEKLSDLRRELHRDLTERQHIDVLKGTRWLLLKNPENLDPAKDEPKRLEEALKLNAPLAKAYYLKEELRQLWRQKDKPTAHAFLMSWVHQALTSGIRTLASLAKSFAAKRSGLLAFYDHEISSAKLEGFNNKIKTMQRQAYGYRDHEFFILKIFALHTVKYALIG
jgi:transposase